MKRKPKTDKKPPKKKGMGDEWAWEILLKSESDDSEEEMVEFQLPPNLLVFNPGLEGLQPGSLFIANSDTIEKEENDSFSYINTGETIDVYNNGFLVVNLKEKIDFMDKMNNPTMQPPASCPPRCQVQTISFIFILIWTILPVLVPT